MSVGSHQYNAMSDTSPATSPATGSTQSADLTSAAGRPPRSDDTIGTVVAVAATALLARFIVFVATRPHHDRSAANSVTPDPTLPIASTAPAFALSHLGGGPTVELTSTRGTPTFVNFFAACYHNFPAALGDFAALASRTQGRVVHVALGAQSASALPDRTAVLTGKAG